MPYITNASYAVGHYDILLLAGSGFTSSGFTLRRIGIVDANDKPESTVRNPSGTIQSYLTSGLANELSLSDSSMRLNQDLANITVLDDSMCVCTVPMSNSGLSPNFWLVPYSPSQGSGTQYMINRPEGYYLEDPMENNTFTQGRTYKLFGRALTLDGSWSFDTTPKIYFQSTADTGGTSMVEGTYYYCDGGTQDVVKEEQFAYCSFTVPTGLTNGSYNIHYYPRWNKHSIVSFSGVTIGPLTEPSSIVFNTSDYGITSHPTNNQSTLVQNLIWIAASSVLATPSSKANIIFPGGHYQFNNRITLVSGVYMTSYEKAQLEFAPNMSTALSYTNTIPSVHSSVVNNTLRYGCIRLTEYCGIDGFEIINGNRNQSNDIAIYMEKNRVTSSTQFEGHVTIKNNIINCPYLQQNYAIFHTNYYSNVVIENNDIISQDCIDSDISSSTGGHWRKRWSVQNNKFKGSSGRVTSSSAGRFFGIENIIAYNEFTNLARGIIHQQSNGPCYRNTLLRNDFYDMADNFNASEVILFENPSASYFNGYPQSATSTSVTLSNSIWQNIPPSGLGVDGNKYKAIMVKSGPGAGQVRNITGSISGILTVSPAWVITPTTASWIDYGHVCSENNIVSTRIHNTNGGIEFFGRNINNYVGNTEAHTCGKAINLYAPASTEIGVCWNNTFNGTKLYHAQILFNTFRASGVALTPSGHNLFLMNKFYETFMVDSPFTVQDVLFRTTSQSSTDLYGTSFHSGLVPYIKGIGLAKTMFDADHWRVTANKVLHMAPINVPTAGMSGLYTTSYLDNTNFGSICINGIDVSTTGVMRNLTGTMGNSIRKWVYA